MLKSPYTFLTNILQNPFFILFTVLLGLGIGFYSPETGKILEPYGLIFMSLLEMSLVPIVICAIALSISNLLSLKSIPISSTRIVATLLALALGISFLSSLLAYFLDPAAGFLSSENLKIKEISTASAFVDRGLDISIIKTEKGGLTHFLENSIPQNIFKALASSSMLKIIVFSLIFGIAVAYSATKERMKIQAFFSTTLSVFQKIISNITVWLPIAIIALMAGGSSSIGFEMMIQMGSFILKVYGIFFLIFIISTLIIQKRSGLDFFAVIKELKDPIVISFGTRSAILPIPSILQAFDQKLKFDKSLVKLLVPLGSVLGRFGNIAYFAILAIFIANIYQTDVTPSVVIIVSVLSVLGGLSTAGATGILTLTSLTIILNPLHLPLGAVLPLLIAIDTIIDPMRTLVSVYTNCAAISLVAPKVKEYDKPLY